MKKSNVRKSPISYDTLPITDAESGVKWKVPRLLLECSMQQLQNEISTSPDYGGLIGSRHANTNNVIISDKMIRSLATLQLHPMKENQKLCVVVPFVTLQSFQESLNAWRQKQLKS